MASLNSGVLRQNDNDRLQQTHQEHERLRTVTAFLVFGIVTYASYSLLIAGAQDILAGTFIQTSSVLIANIGPYFVVTLIAPCFMQKIPYFTRIALTYVLYICGFLMLALAKQVYWKLIGAGIVSFGVGVSEMTFLALTSFYQEVASTAFSAGTGLGFLIAPLYYTAMTTWACISPNVTVLIMAAMLPLGFVWYFVMDKKHLESPSPPTDEHAGVKYTSLDTKDNKADHRHNNTDSGVGSLSTWEKSTVIRQMLPGLILFFIAWFSEYMIIESVVTTLAFADAPFKPRDHYQYYIFVLVSGEMMGKSYLVISSYIKEEWVEKAKFPYLWVLATIEAMLLVFFVLAAWYRFLPSVWIVFLLLFTCGAVIGVFYVNGMTFFRNSVKDRYQEFAMGYISVSMGGGILAAGLLGLYVEPLLREHCTMFANNTDFCFTRSKSLDRFTSSCLT